METTAGVTTRILALAAAPDSPWLASEGIDGTVKMCDLAAGVQQHSFTGHSDWVTGLAESSEGLWLASGDDTRTVRTWNLMSVGMERSHDEHCYAINRLTASSDPLMAGGSRRATRMEQCGSGT